MHIIALKKFLYFFYINIFILDYLSKAKSNSIKETQILNKIIYIEKKNYRYSSFASYSNDDMVLTILAYFQNTCSPRIFLVLKKMEGLFLKMVQLLFIL